jgi:hypothetical protein
MLKKTYIGKYIMFMNWKIHYCNELEKYPFHKQNNCKENRRTETAHTYKSKLIEEKLIQTGG